MTNYALRAVLRHIQAAPGITVDEFIADFDTVGVPHFVGLRQQGLVAIDPESRLSLTTKGTEHLEEMA